MFDWRGRRKMHSSVSLSRGFWICDPTIRVTVFLTKSLCRRNTQQNKTTLHTPSLKPSNASNNIGLQLREAGKVDRGRKKKRKV
ncbi:hypothetical protein Ahy_A05g022160 isoform D [Arachis hypogaea]|uniref:Uncharacterized protein n=1 Tax=Arachis hypogaea TaxID=3818 RepID=A0A445CZW5_ARAHY|nr:hypothetical protein Ahy_A05g022160 isoform D [Arachis hypogaea]